MNANEMQWLFSTPLMEFNLSEYATPAVTKVLMEMQQTTNSAVHGIRGARNPAELPECRALYVAFQQCVDQYSQLLSLRRNLIHASWVNILYQGGSVDIHRHHDSVISGAFYPHVETNSSPLIFVSPLDGYRMMDSTRFVPSPDGQQNIYAGNAHLVPSANGKLVLFPSWLQHYVPQNKSNLRVTLSFNTNFA